MAWSDYWGALTARQRTGLLSGIVVAAVALTTATIWLLDDPYVPLETDLTADRLGEIAQQLDRAKLDYRVADDASTVSVPRSQAGKARAAAAAGPSAVPPGVGLELFKETDFSSTDFAQRMNYQRALQGELTRTIQSISGVRSARVHVILADSGLFKREGAKASAAVSVAMKPGSTLSRAQVRGIQRLVAASVPEIKIDDVVVIDESGTSLTRPASDAEGDVSSAQLDLKRQVDQYLEAKLQRLLQDLVPQGSVSLSVDTELDARQSRVTTEEPLAVPGAKDADKPAGVLVKERQSQHGRASGSSQVTTENVDPDSAEWEYEYKVGHRMEQILSSPGSLRRLSVAVVLQGSPSNLTSADVERLVAHAVGVDSGRGDSVDVLLLPVSAAAAAAIGSPARLLSVPSAQAQRRSLGVAASPDSSSEVIRSPGTWLLAAVLVALVALAWRSRRWSRLADEAKRSDAEVDAAVAKVHQWLAEGHGDARG